MSEETGKEIEGKIMSTFVKKKRKVYKTNSGRGSSQEGRVTSVPTTLFGRN